MKIPEYKTVAGLRLANRDIGNGATQICIENTNEKECMDYASLLEESGFEKYEERKIPCGSEDDRTNLFYTYIKADVHIFVSFCAPLRVVQITAKLPRPLAKKEQKTCKENAQMSITQCKIEGGMSYAVQLADYSFVLIDGGLYNKEDVQNLYKFMKEKTPQGKKPVICMWFFTHPDIDHVGLATGFIRDFAKEVEIQAFAYQFPKSDKVELLYQDEDIIKTNIEKLEESIRLYCPNSSVYTLYTGQVYNFCGAEAEILWTADMLFPHPALTANDLSAAFRFRFKGGKTALFLGDCMHFSCRQIAHTYKDYLKSDILQVTHHGLIGGELDTYKLIDPEICLWSTQKERFEGTLNEEFHWCIGEGGCDYNAWLRDNSVRHRTHYHMSESVTIPVE